MRVTLQLPRGSPIRGHQALEVFLPKDPSQPHPLARQWGPDLHPVLQDHHHPQTPPHFTLPSQIQHFKMQTLSHLSKLRSPPIVPSALGINTGSWLGPQTTAAKSQAPMTPPCSSNSSRLPPGLCRHCLSLFFFLHYFLNYVFLHTVKLFF